MSDIKVWTAELRTAAKGWADQHTALRAARTKLAHIESSTGTAGARVQPALDQFLSTWVDELNKYARAAERHSDNLDAGAANYDRTDEDARADLAKLLPWDQRNSAPDTGPGPGAPGTRPGGGSS